MYFWIGISIALLISLGLATAQDASYVQRTYDNFSLIILVVVFTLVVFRVT